jgi:hypothetical protein
MVLLQYELHYIPNDTERVSLMDVTMPIEVRPKGYAIPYSFPRNIPANTRVPHWSYLDVVVRPPRIFQNRSLC